MLSTASPLAPGEIMPSKAVHRWMLVMSIALTLQGIVLIILLFK
jgi:hypothetical protein